MFEFLNPHNSYYLIFFSGGPDDRSRLFFRPLSVQERIRELNLRARHFAETIMAVQLHETLGGSQGEYASLMHTRSLQVWLFCINKVKVLYINHQVSNTGNEQ